MTITGAQVKVARQLLGWTQEILAAEIRVSSSTIGAFETGQRRPSATIGIFGSAIGGDHPHDPTRPRGGRRRVRRWCAGREAQGRAALAPPRIIETAWTIGSAFRLGPLVD